MEEKDVREGEFLMDLTKNETVSIFVKVYPGKQVART
jgi:hypothetical protein